MITLEPGFWSGVVPATGGTMTDMAQVSAVGGLFAAVTGAAAGKTTFFDIGTAPWVKVNHSVEGGPSIPESVRGKVDMHAFFDGMEIQVIDCGAYNILQTK